MSPKAKALLLALGVVGLLFGLWFLFEKAASRPNDFTSSVAEKEAAEATPAIESPSLIPKGTEEGLASEPGREAHRAEIHGLVLDSAEKPVAGIAVYRASLQEPLFDGVALWDLGVYSGGEFPREDRTETGPDGRFTFSGFFAFPLSLRASGAAGSSEVVVLRQPPALEAVLHLRRPLSVRGKILSLYGEPIPGSRIAARRDPSTRSGSWSELTLETKAEFLGSQTGGEVSSSGEFEVALAPPARGPAFYLLEAWAPGFSRDFSSVQVLEGRAIPSDGFEFRLHPEASVHGVVRDPAGDPVAGARVAWGFEGPYSEGGPGPTTRTGPDGAYRLQGMGSGREVWVAASAPEFAMAVDRVFGLAPGEARQLDLQLAPGSFVTGTVVDSEGTPLAGAEVSLGEEGAVRFFEEAVTKEDGSFSVGGWPKGRAFSLRAAKRGYQPEARPLLAEKDLPAKLVLRLLARLDVHVRTEDGLPLPHDCRVVAFRVDRTGRVEETLNAERGENAFWFSGLGEGKHELWAACEGYVSAHKPVTVPSGLPSLPPVDLLLRRGALLRARVLDSATKRPIRDARMTLSERTTTAAFAGWVEGQARSDGEGRIESAEFPAGERILIFKAEGYSEKDMRTQVPEAGILDLGEILLDAGSEILGIVRDDEGNPYPGVSILFHSEARYFDFAEGGVTREDGTYSIRGLRAGNYQIRFGEHFLRPGRGRYEFHATRWISLGGNESKRWDFRFDPGVRIEGRLRLKDGPLTDEAFIQLYKVGGDDYDAAKTDTDYAGRFSFHGVQPGEYLLGIVTMNAARPRSLIRKLTVEKQEVLKLDLLLPENTVRGRVLAGSPSEPVAGALVRIVDASYYFLSAETDEAGVFELQGMQPGSFGLYVEKAGLSRYLQTGVTIPEDGVHDVGDILLPPPAALTVDARGLDGNSFPGVSLVLKNASPFLSVTSVTDAAGKAVFDFLQPGDYVIKKNDPSVFPVEVPVPLTSAKSSQIEVVLRRRGKLRFVAKPDLKWKIRDLATGADLATWLAKEWIDVRPAGFRTDETGTMEIERLAEGSYEFLSEDGKTKFLVAVNPGEWTVFQIPEKGE